MRNPRSKRPQVRASLRRAVRLRSAGVASLAVGAVFVFGGCPGLSSAITVVTDSGRPMVVIKGKFSSTLWDINRNCAGDSTAKALCTFNVIRSTACVETFQNLSRATCYDVTEPGEAGDFADAVANQGGFWYKCLTIHILSAESPPFNWTVRDSTYPGCSYT